MIRKKSVNRLVWVMPILIAATLLHGCSKNDTEKSKQAYWLPDAKEEQLPLVAYHGISSVSYTHLTLPTKRIV